MMKMVLHGSCALRICFLVPKEKETGVTVLVFFTSACLFGLLRQSFVNVCQFLYVILSFLVLRVGWGIWLLVSDH